MTTLKETISTFERHHELDEENRAIILSALRTQQERENPKPLSLDELREMDGEPVWIESGDGAVCAYSGWAIVGRYYDDSVALYVPGNVYYEAAVRHGTVIVYAHKPGGSAEMNQKPPLGLKPKLVHDEQRLFEVSGAIGRYFIAGLPIPVEWVEEYNQLVKSLKGAVST